MTEQDHRIIVEKLAKFITWFLVVIISSVVYTLEISSITISVVITTLWFYGPDIIAYLLESWYNLKHDHTTYR